MLWGPLTRRSRWDRWRDRAASQHCGGEALDGLDVERRSEREVDLVRARLDVLADLVEDLLLAAGERAGPDVVGHGPELRLQRLLRPRQRDVDGAPDLVRIA